MPPKSSSSAAWPQRRTPRATARKTNPTPNPKFTVKSTTKSPAAAADVSLETPTPTIINAEPPPPSLTSPIASPTHKTTPETTANKLTSVASADDVTQEAQSTTVPSLTNPKMDAEATGQMGVEETLVEKVPPAPENVAIEAAAAENNVEAVQETGAQEGGMKTGVKTVTKKTVRVVKKVVKKKVAKRVRKDQSVLSNEESKKLGPSNDGESSSPSVLGELEVENPNRIETLSVEVENPNSNGTGSLEIDNSKSNDIVSMVAENSNSNPPSVIVSMEVEKPSSDVDVSMKDENPKDLQVCEREKDASVTKNLSVAPVLDSGGTKNDGDEGEMTETQLEDQNVVPVGDQSDGPKTENANSGSGEGVKENKTEYVNSGSDEGGKGVKEKAEDSEVGGLSTEVGLGDGVLLSGELEALERRRRRKTEIFIGGLDKDAKEEDIRKIFEEVGEVIEVRLKMNGKTGKGFAFVRYASAADAKKALAKFHEVEICGRQCGTSPVEGNDTLFLGNIDKKWKSEDVVRLLQEIGIEKIDKVTVMADPKKVEFNRGFAFLELETNKDAQNALHKLQKKDVFGKHLKVKVAWAEPLIEPDEKEMLKVKSVYAEYIPSSWDEEKVREYFKRFGEIENVTLARNLRSSKRKDFAFVNYTTREAALLCIEAFSREQLNDEDSKVNVKVSLAKPIPKSKQIKHVLNPKSTELFEVKQKVAQSAQRPQEPRRKGKATSSNYEDIRVDTRASTTSELVQLLREQASWRNTQPGLGRGSDDLVYTNHSSGRKRSFSVLGDDPHYSDPRGYPRMRLGNSYPVARPSALSQGVGMTYLPHYHQQESFNGVEDYPSYSQTRERGPYHGSTGIYRRY